MGRRSGRRAVRETMRVAAWSPVKGFAELRDADGRVAGIDTSMRALAELQTPMSAVVEIVLDWKATAAGGPYWIAGAHASELEAVVACSRRRSSSGLETQLAAVANLSGSMDQLAQLREPMDRLAGLEAPMARLAGLSSLLDRPGRLILFSLIALLGWGIVTFLAVRLAIVSAGRRRGEGV